MNATDYTTPAPVREETNARNAERRRAALEACGRANLRAAAWFALVSYLDGGALDGAVRLSHSDLAARIGMTPQALNQGVRALCNIGVLMRDGRGLRITPDPAGAFGNAETEKRYVSETQKRRNATFPTVLETEKRSVSETAPPSPPDPPSFPYGEREEKELSSFPPKSPQAQGEPKAMGPLEGYHGLPADFQAFCAEAEARRGEPNWPRCLRARALADAYCNDPRFRDEWASFAKGYWAIAREAVYRRERNLQAIDSPVGLLRHVARQEREQYLRDRAAMEEDRAAGRRREPRLACDRVHVAPPDSPYRKYAERLRAAEVNGHAC